MRLGLFTLGAMPGVNSVAKSRLCFFRRDGGSASPAIHFFLRQADLREDAAYVLGNQIVDGFWVVIKGRNGRHDDRAGLLRPQHVAQMDAVEGSVSHAKDELAIFFEHYVGGARHEIVAQTVGDGCERAHGAGDDQHGMDFVAAGGDGRANIFVGQNFYFCGCAAKEARGELLQIAGRNVQLLGEEALAGFGYDQMNTLDSWVVFKEFEGFLREDCAAGAGYAHGYDLFFLLSHGQFVDRFSVATGLGQVKISA